MTVCLKIIAINSLFLSSINLSIYHKSLSAIDQSTWCVFSLSKLNGGFPFACFPVFSRAWMLRVFPRLAVTCFHARGCYVFSRAWLLRIFQRLVVTCFLVSGCYVFYRTWLLRVVFSCLAVTCFFPRLVVTCFLVLDCYVFFPRLVVTCFLVLGFYVRKPIRDNTN